MRSYLLFWACFLLLSGCASAPSIDQAATNYAKIEIVDNTVFYFEEQLFENKELFLDELPGLVQKSGKSKVLVGLKTNPSIARVVEIGMKLKPFGVATYFINGEEAISEFKIELK